MTRPTIYDVAHQAGVSPATVSNVLNTPRKVNEDTRKRVMEVIDQLHYIPTTSHNRKSNSFDIGVVAMFSSYSCFHTRLAGALPLLSQPPYRLVMFDQKDPQREGEFLARLPLSKPLDGLIVMSLPLSAEVAQRLKKRGLHTVLIETHHPGFSSVEVDNFAGGQLAAEHLLSKGRKRPAFIGEKQFAESSIILSSQRLKGFREVLDSAGIGLPAPYISLGPYSVQDAQRQATELLQLPSPPDAIFCYCDHQAVGVLRAAKALGLKVPDDLAVMGFDDMDFAGFLGLTTVHQALQDSGRIAAQLLLDRIHHPQGPTQQVTLPVKVIERETT